MVPNHAEDEPSTVSLLLSDNGEAAIERWIFEVIDGPDLGLSYESDSGTIIAGTSAEANLRLKDDSVSRAHAEMHLLASGVVVVDLDSRNGTRIGSRRIERALVASGGTVRLGRTEIRIRAAKSPR